MPYFCYLLECGDSSYYCGWTNDLKKRFNTHQQGKGGRYTRTRQPVKLVYYEELNSRSAAMRREWELRHKSHSEKQKLANSFCKSE